MNKRRGPARSKIQVTELPATHAEVLPGESQPAMPLGSVPEHVAAVFMQVAEKAADRLNHMVSDDKVWRAMKPSEQKALIELVFLRAYGAPINRSLSVELTSDDADAVAKSLVAMHERLPEQRVRTVQPVQATTLPKQATRRQRRS